MTVTEPAPAPSAAAPVAGDPAVDLDVVPLSGTIGAVIRGLDVRALDDATVAAVRQVWLDRPRPPFDLLELERGP